jgi:hypothetical protein
MKKQKEPRGQLASALAFLNLTFKDEDQGMYCMIGNHEARSFNFVLAAGTTVEEDLQACPQLDLMLEAIERCGPEYSITQLSPSKLLVRSAGFQAYIPCILPDKLSWPLPDAEIAPLGDRFIEALREIAPLLSATAETVLESSIQLNTGSCIATDRQVILEAWHGYDLPSGLLIPKAIVTALHKSAKSLRGFGCSDKTATFWFEDSTWLRTQLFRDKWPIRVKEQLNCYPQLRAVPQFLFEAAKKVMPFSSNGLVYIKDELISSHPFDAIEEGSKLQLPIGSFHAERIYDWQNLKRIQKHVVLWDEGAKGGTYFEGDNIRGMIVDTRPQKEQDDDIPF